VLSAAPGIASLVFGFAFTKGCIAAYSNIYSQSNLDKPGLETFCEDQMRKEK
jgi:hypothetical protein